LIRLLVLVFLIKHLNNMADAPQINVIKPGGFNFHPIDSPRKNRKLNPLVIGILTVVLAIVTVVAALMLYKSRNQPQVPLPANASVTTTISDDFSGSGNPDPAKWNFGLNSSATISQTGGLLVMSLPAGQATVSAITAVNGTTQYFTGDFAAQVDLLSITTSGTAWQEFGFGSPIVSVRRTVSATTDKLETIGGSSPAVNLPSGTTSVTVQIKRVGSLIQTFYVLPNSQPALMDTISSGPGLLADGAFYLVGSTTEPDYQAATASFDNFSAQVNLANAPSPTPGTAAACTVSFSVLDTVATPTITLTPTPSPTSVPGATATPTPTPSPTLTPTPISEPNSCGGTCGSNANCQSGLVCYQGVCRNPECSTATNCVCSESSPTTPPAVNTPAPTPPALQQAGSVNGTLILGIGGLALLVFGGLMLLVF
jgi:hypothetical protein